MLDVAKEVWQNSIENFVMIYPAAFISSVVTYLDTTEETLLCWVLLSTLDCVFGIIVAVTSGAFCAVKLFKWVSKFTVQLLLILLLVMTFHVINLTLGVEHFITNWVLLFFILLDFSSLANKLLYFGLLPKPLIIILKYLRHNFAKAFSTMLHTPGAMEELEKALAEHAPSSPPSSDSTLKH